MIGETDSLDLTIVAVVKNGAEKEIKFDVSMLSAEDIAKISTVGTHTLTVNYENCVCNFSITVKAPGCSHTYGEWLQTVAPTCTVVGSEKRVCSVCGNEETREISATGHDYEAEWTIDLAPMCTVVGSEKRVCSVCGNEETREISATGHTFGEWTHTVIPTNEVDGTERRDCENCDHYETKESKSFKNSIFSFCSAGDEYSMAIDTDGKLWAWGENYSGKLGNGTPTDSSTPINIMTDKTFVKVSAGDYHSSAIDSEGNLWTWGDNTKGQLGDGTTTN